MEKFDTLAAMYEAAGAAGLAESVAYTDGYRSVTREGVDYTILFYAEPIHGHDVIFSARQISTAFTIQRWADSNNLAECEESARSVIRAARGAFKP